MSKLKKILYGIPLIASVYLSTGLENKVLAETLCVPSQYSTIQSAIDNSRDGDEIIVSPGRYKENIDFSGKNIILRSINPRDKNVIENTIIDGNQAGSVVTFSGNEGTTCILEGFTITNGKNYEGGGIRGNETKATVQYNAISRNTAFNGLTIIDIGDDKGFICAIYFYHPAIGGGLDSCDGLIQNNLISGNSAIYGGGGLNDCDGIIQNNIISNNSIVTTSRNIPGGDNISYEGFGAGLYNCNGIIRNNTITRNYIFRYADIDGDCPIVHFITFGSGLAFCRDTIKNSIIWDNFGAEQISLSSIPSYSCIQNLTSGGEGNISLDPQFVDPVNGDYHLKNTSPCIDAGMRIENLLIDIEGNPRGIKGTTEQRGDGSNYDIGVYEYDPVRSAVFGWEMYE